MQKSNMIVCYKTQQKKQKIVKFLFLTTMNLEVQRQVKTTGKNYCAIGIVFIQVMASAAKENCVGKLHEDRKRRLPRYSFETSEMYVTVDTGQQVTKNKEQGQIDRQIFIFSSRTLGLSET